MMEELSFIHTRSGKLELTALMRYVATAAGRHTGIALGIRRDQISRCRMNLSRHHSPNRPPHLLIYYDTNSGLGYKFHQDIDPDE